MVNLVEESQVLGHVHPLLNSTYIALITKKPISHSFSDFPPISLCNLIYKIFSKTIANHFRLTLYSFITPQQLNFLKNRQIHDIIAIAQECLHYIHSKNLNAAIMQVDLKKAFDSLDWGYLGPVLHKVGIQSSATKLIMACVTNVQYAVIINGYLMTFFKAGRGLRQGCSLSPLLFILALDGLSLHITNAVVDEHFQPLHIDKNIWISHIFFIDDMLITEMLNRFAWLHLFHIFFNFGNATDLMINQSKSAIIHVHGDRDITDYIANLFRISSENMSSGLKYLRFHIKPCKYRVLDSQWFVDRFYKKILGWEFRCLSMGSCFTLTRVLITHVGLYWAHLFYLPISIIKNLTKITAHFI